jgi:2-polyprenyl-3-methyl-5-hydroxy-6-metoxy-1,4-benzoquinol methylase
VRSVSVDRPRLLPPDKEARLRDALVAAYPEKPSDLELEIEIELRQFGFSDRYMPWLASVVPLKRRKVLEIGAGTGTSTIPILEMGASVVAVDLNAAGLEVAKTRAELHGVDHLLTTRCLNAVDVGPALAGQSFDLVVYFASLEHMTGYERTVSLRDSWSLLNPGGYLAVCDAPNRLWFFDNHTSTQNFYHWLPDGLAARYAERTPRTGFNTSFLEPSSDEADRLAWWGRGVSFHDFEVALGIDVKSLTLHGEGQFRRERLPDWAAAWHSTIEGRYFALLQEIAPDIPAPFLEDEIALAMQKPAE